VPDPGAELHPQAAALLAAAAASTRPNAHLLPVAEARRHFDAEFAALGPGEPVDQVADVGIAVEGETIRARVYRPGGGRRAVVVYFHGGGWVLGSIDSHDAACRALSNASGAVVVSVGYRRGPEHRFPTAVEDAYAATLWVAEQGEALDVDPARLAVAGDSAGGNLATAVAVLARDRRAPAVAFQLLVYPVTTTDLEKGFDPGYEGVFLYRDEMQWHQDNYLATPDDRESALVSPLDAADLRGLPPAMVITAGCDPLHAQGELYARALQTAGVPVEHADYRGMAHGFFQMPGVLDDGRDAIARAGAALRAVLAEPAVARRLT
jgi:acetyl esterase/lipase